MMATPTSSSHEANNSSRSRELQRKKRRKINFQDDDTEGNLKLDSTKWRTQAEQQIYYTKLVEALRQVRRNSSSSLGSRTVRDTADRVLAITAKGKTLWSRAIVNGRHCLRMAHINKKHRKVATVSGNIRSRKPAVKKTQTLFQRKVRFLGRLVPGCRKISFANLLQEATDYIAALEMQVRAMTALAGLLTGPAAGGSLPAPPSSARISPS